MASGKTENARAARLYKERRVVRVGVDEESDSNSAGVKPRRGTFEGDGGDASVVVVVAIGIEEQ